MNFIKNILFVIPAFVFVQAAGCDLIAQPRKMQWTVDGVTREALVYIPEEAKVKPIPLVFAFHGHGGNMLNSFKRYGFHNLWPEAIFVSPQGLTTPGTLTDKEGKKSGWQNNVGVMGDRDLRFFDSMLESFKQKYKIDAKRIYATGHSNGGLFTYLLWAERGDVFAAVAPSGAAALKLTKKLKSKPALHLMGEKDPLVKPVWQRLTYGAVLRLNQCSSDGKKTGIYTTLYESKSGNPVVLYIHPGGHELPIGAGKAIADFFRQHTKP